MNVMCCRCEYCIQDCRQCLLNQQCETQCGLAISFMLCLPCCDRMLHFCHKHNNCKDFVQSDCCLKSSSLLRSSGRSCSDIAEEENTKEQITLEVPSSPITRHDSYQMATNVITDQPKSVRFHAEDEVITVNVKEHQLHVPSSDDMACYDSSLGDDPVDVQITADKDQESVDEHAMTDVNEHSDVSMATHIDSDDTNTALEYDQNNESAKQDLDEMFETRNVFIVDYKQTSV